MTNVLPKMALSAALATLAVVPAPAAGPFQIRRATSPASVGSAAPIATVATAPFEDLSARYADGVTYYYAVYDASGAALDVSASADPVTRAVRIGFDDGNPASAPVDASRSTVSLSATSIRADGLQTATLTIVPKDANGVALGRGLSVAVDAAMLWPLRLVSPIADRGDGSYSASAIAAVPGTGIVRVSVEGIVLASTPEIAATPVTGANPRDLAIAEIADLSSTSGPIASLVTQAGSGTSQAAALSSALSATAAAAAALANGDWKRDDNVLKTDLDGVLRQLAGVLADPGTADPAAIRQVMDGLVDAARLVAVAHVDAAAATCGACGSDGRPRRVCDAEAALASSDALRSASNPDWSAIVDGYARAVELALQAEQSC